jgi:hypothetical protein
MDHHNKQTPTIDPAVALLAEMLARPAHPSLVVAFDHLDAKPRWRADWMAWCLRQLVLQ